MQPAKVLHVQPRKNSAFKTTNLHAENKTQPRILRKQIKSTDDSFSLCSVFFFLPNSLRVRNVAFMPDLPAYYTTDPSPEGSHSMELCAL